MSRSPVSVIVVASGAPDVFRTCLESLRLSRDQHDEVVCVVPGDRTDLQREVADASWLTVVEDDSGRIGSAWSRGVDATTHPVVVLVDGDVLLPPHWLEPVAEAMTDPGVVAAGPRCQLTAGPQRADVPAAELKTPDAFKQFARKWRHQHRGQRRTTDTLGPVCVAVRRDALTAAGTDFEKLRGRGRLVVVHEAVVAHLDSGRCSLRALAPGHGPFLSTVLLTRNDAQTLAGTLDSVRPFADEIVVYDLGSDDRTREIAAEHGVRFVDGRWDCDYGATRSRAIEAANGEWVLCLDADETLTGDPKAVRDTLLLAGMDTFLVPVRPSARAEGAPETTPAMRMRLFRRARARFTGRVHEYVIDRIGGEPIDTPNVLNCLVVQHADAPAEPGHARNLRRPPKTPTELQTAAATLLEKARTAIIAEDFTAAARLCREVIDGDARGGVYEAALKTLMNSLIPLGELAAANKALDELRERAAPRHNAHEWEARIRFAEGDYLLAVESTRRLPGEPTAEAPTVADRDQLAEIEIKSLFRLGRYREATDRLRAVLRTGIVPLTVAEMAEAFIADGSGLAEAVALVPAKGRGTLLYSAREAPAELADELLDALFAVPDEELAVLGVIGQLGRLLPLHRALAWSRRLRERNLAQLCPLLRISAEADRPTRERILAAAVAFERFSDDDALPLLSAALDEVPDDDTEAVLAELREVAPGVAASVEPVGAH